MRFSNIGFILKKEEYKFNSGFMKSFSSFFILLKSFLKPVIQIFIFITLCTVMTIQAKKIDNSYLKCEARRLGFAACGIARAEPVEKETADRLRAWLSSGGEANMHYMATHTDKRLDPRLLVPDVKSIVSVALNYAPARTFPEEEYQLAAYAYGRDYHDLMKGRLRELARTMCNALGESTESVRVFVDTAPVLERYWAWKAGLGWTGKNHQLIIPHGGTMFFLGEIFFPFDADAYDSSMLSRCGSCRQCLDACPTGAIVETKEFCSEKCLSYQLIENRGELSAEAKSAMGNMIYGCDRCQEVCPWNRFANPTDEPLLQPSDELMSMCKTDWQRLTPEKYRTLFKGSAVKRVKFEGIKRNINAANSNNKDL